MDAAEQKLSLVSEEDARQPLRPDGWSRKEILGHLVDSACINHVRIVFATTLDGYECPKYDQDAWVVLHGYAQVPWPAILDQWRARYTWMAEMVTNLPDAALDRQFTITGFPPTTIADWINDCLQHLDHHVHQIVTVPATT
ncbi:DinB family protein [Candidatus Korobacter versatilis]|nr:DinB family protein [Candidatus Koribacter versatilis]